MARLTLRMAEQALDAYNAANGTTYALRHECEYTRVVRLKDGANKSGPFLDLPHAVRGTPRQALSAIGMRPEEWL